MRFFVRKRHQTPTVIIVALIDVLIVLLIFLMVTTTFKQQAALRIALPESTQAQKLGASDTGFVTVSVDAKGVIRFGENNLPVTDQSLKEKLLEAKAQNPDRKMAINADKEAPFGQIVKVMDAAREAKIPMANAFVKEAAKE